MTLLTAHWAFFSKKFGGYQDYQILSASAGLLTRPDEYEVLVRRHLLGIPPREAQNTTRPEALPWTGFAPTTIDGTDYLGVSIVELSRDANAGAIYPVRYFWFAVADLAGAQPSYSSLAQATFLTPLRVTGTAPLTMPVERLDTVRLAERIDRDFGFHRVASQTALLLESPIALLNSAALPRPDRLNWFDAMMGLLPYGFRFDFPISTWAHWDAKRIRLNFGSRPSDGQQAVDWNRGVSTTAIKTDLGQEYLALLLALHRRHGTAALLAHLARPEVTVLRANEPANALYALRHFETPHLISLESAMSSPPRQMRIGLWGATLSGKTTYLAALRIATLRSSPDNQWRIEGIDDASDDFLADNTNILMGGYFPPGTQTMKEYQWLFTGRGDGDAPVQFNLNSVDVPGVVYDDKAGRNNPEWEEFLVHLTECNGLVFLLDPLRADSFQHMQRAMSRLTRTMRASGELVNERLPHFVAACVTKFDDPRIFQLALDGNWVTFVDAKTGKPSIVKPKEYFEHVAEEDVTAMLRQFFNEARLGYFVTSSIGFRIGAKGFDLGDYANVKVVDRESRIVGKISPINVLEPLLWLEEQIRMTRDKRPAGRKQ